MRASKVDESDIPGSEDCQKAHKGGAGLARAAVVVCVAGVGDGGDEGTREWLGRVK